jgi:hypothetical protein
VAKIITSDPVGSLASPTLFAVASAPASGTVFYFR